MRYLQLEKHLIPIILIKRVEQQEEPGTDEGEPVIWLHTVIKMRDGEEVRVGDDFDEVCDLLNPGMDSL